MPTVIVTGGGGALGQGISKALATNGWRIVVADINKAFALETIEMLGDSAVKTPVVLDVGDYPAVRAAVGDVARQHGVNGLVNAAGGTMALRVPKGALVDSLPEHWDRMIGVNLYGTFNCCHCVAPFLKSAGGGAIVSIASGAGLPGGSPPLRQAGAAVYSATKAGVIAFTQALAIELGPYGIRVNAVAPGRAESRDKPMAKMLEMRAAEEAKSPGSGRLSPLGRYGRASDIGDAVAFLFSEQASLITGSCLDLTGGIRLH
jgi:3-oxoacyl-[acyl-carrier protein] reductase